MLAPLNAHEQTRISSLRAHPLLANVTALSWDELLALLLQRRFLSLSIVNVYEGVIDALESDVIKATVPPIVILTSNRTREIHDAVKRRCLYHWVDYPDAARELDIVRRKSPGAAERLTGEIVGFVQNLRGQDLFKLPGVAETIDWTRALMELDRICLDPETINDTLGVLLKYQDDIARIKGSEAASILAQVQADMAAGR